MSATATNSPNELKTSPTETGRKTRNAKPSVPMSPARKASRAALGLATAFYALLLAVISLGNALGPERWTLSGINLYLPQWLWALPAPFLLLWTWFAARRWTLAQLIPPLWVGVVLMGLSWHFVNSTRPGTPLRVMTYNVKWTRHDTLVEVAREIGLANPDVLLIQDTSNRLPALLQATHPEWHFLRAGQYVIAGPANLGMVEEKVMPGAHPWRNLTYARTTLTLGNQVVAIYDVHLLSPRYGLAALKALKHGDPEAGDQFTGETADRLAEINAVADSVAQETIPVLLAGDLNASVYSQVCKRLAQAGLEDAFSHAGRGYGYTYGHNLKFRHSYMRIDHILTSRQWDVKECHAGDSSGSDHCPVIADLVLASDSKGR